MKFFANIAVVLLLCGLAGSAKAYRINVLDPYTTHQIFTQPFDATFDPCQVGQISGSLAGKFCFTGQNVTGSTITTLEIVFPNVGPLAGLPLTCDAIAGSIFTSSSCSVIGGQQVFFFSGLNIPTFGSVGTRPGEDSFLILIEDLPEGTTAADIPLGTGTFPDAPPSTVPEPSSIALLSTGLASLGATTWRKRRWFGSRKS